MANVILVMAGAWIEIKLWRFEAIRMMGDRSIYTKRRIIRMALHDG